MYAPSLVSASNTSQSKLAKSPPLFSAWKIRSKVVEILNPPANVTAHFDNFYQLEEVPSTLIQGPLPMPTYNTEADFQHAVREWASTLCPTDEDEYNILGVLPTLALAYNRIQKMSNNQSKEHSQRRRGIDDIVEIAFSESIGRHCDFIIEQSYCVVELDFNADAQSDLLVTIPSNKVSDKIRKGRFSFADPNTMDNLYWSTNGVEDHFSIIGFAGEFKKDDTAQNKNQLIMVLTTAQSQRKALSLKDSILIGATGCRGQVQFHSSFWENDGILRIYTHEQKFHLTNPVDVIRLYVFCSKLEKYCQDNLASELQEWDAPEEETVKNFTWGSSTRKRARAETPSPARTRRRIDAGGSNNGLADADGFDDDRLMEVMKWRNEVNIEDQKETISGESEIPGMPGCNSKVEMSRIFGNKTSGNVRCKVSKDWVTSPERPSSPSNTSDELSLPG